jgi:cell division protein ZapA (FtsZ GTPase activity inhibitor)
VSGNIAHSNPLQIAILAALNIADEYFQLKEMKVGLTGALEDKARSLISMLDEGLTGDIFSRFPSNSHHA